MGFAAAILAMVLCCRMRPDRDKVGEQRDKKHRIRKYSIRKYADREQHSGIGNRR